jgi:hypothetical protein
MTDTMKAKNIIFIIEDDVDEETYYLRNKEMYRERYLQNIESKRAYQNDYNLVNHEKYITYQKSYYQLKRAKILETKKELVTCECGRVVSMGNLTCHKKTNIHIKRMSNIKLEN